MLHSHNPSNPIQTNNLILELTRRCNMSCPHCMRGEAEDLDMSDDTLRRAIYPHTSISCITFTGGEPSLVPELMKTALEYCQELGIPVYAAYLATNGKRVTDEFLEACDQWHMYCLSCQYNLDRQIEGHELERQYRFLSSKDEPQGMSIALSADPYHEAIPERNLARLMSRSYFRTDKFSTKEFEQEGWIIPAGRAKENIPQRLLRTRRYVSHDLDLETDGEKTLLADEIYVNARGDILADCDLSYEEQESLAIVNVNGRGSWSGILFRQTKKEEESA